VSVRFEQRKDKIAFWRDLKDRPFTLEEMDIFFRTYVPTGWVFSLNPDWNADILLQDNIVTTKEKTALLIAGKDSWMTMAGDGKSDVFRNKQSIIFPQEGTKAHEICQKETIPAIPIRNGVDYALSVTLGLLTVR
jgi:hypothetical protein